jgi:hypothetical protein
MLRGKAKIGSTIYTITAIRVNESLTAPDYRENIDDKTYGAVIDEALEALEFLTDTIDPALLPLESGQYLLWMMPIVAR